MPCFRWVLLLLMALSMVACCPGKGHGANMDTSSSPAGAAPVKGGIQILVPGVQLQAKPAVLQACLHTGQPVEISWNVPAAQAATVNISITDSDDRTKLWAQGKLAGTQTTGSWVTPGMQFTLSSDQDKPLAKLTIGSVPCNK